MVVISTTPQVSMRVTICLLGLLLLSARAITSSPSALTCDVGNYRPQAGLTAANTSGEIVVTWRGAGDQELRVRYAIDAGQPIVRELSVRKNNGTWTALGENLTP